MISKSSGVRPQFIARDVVFMGASAAGDTTPLSADAALFAAPHGTPYPGVDNRVHEGAGDALRRSFVPDGAWVDHWDFDFDGTLLNDGRFAFADLGDLDTSSQDGPGNREKIQSAAEFILGQGAVPIMIGGDDSVPIPFIQAFADHGPVTIVQVDAHIDWRHERRGETLGFSSTMRRASEMDHVAGIVQVGIRGFGSARQEEVAFARQWGATIVPARDVHAGGVEAALQHVPKGAKCILTIDCDALDSGIMPAVMAPTPGGLSYQQAIDLIAGVIAKADLVGMDIIEFVPGRDSNGIAAMTAARLISNAIGRMSHKSAGVGADA